MELNDDKRGDLIAEVIEAWAELDPPYTEREAKLGDAIDRLADFEEYGIEEGGAE